MPRRKAQCMQNCKLLHSCATCVFARRAGYAATLGPCRRDCGNARSSARASRSSRRPCACSPSAAITPRRFPTSRPPPTSRRARSSRTSRRRRRSSSTTSTATSTASASALRDRLPGRDRFRRAAALDRRGVRPGDGRGGRGAPAQAALPRGRGPGQLPGRHHGPRSSELLLEAVADDLDEPPDALRPQLVTAAAVAALTSLEASVRAEGRAAHGQGRRARRARRRHALPARRPRRASARVAHAVGPTLRSPNDPTRRRARCLPGPRNGTGAHRGTSRPV